MVGQKLLWGTFLNQKQCQFELVLFYLKVFEGGGFNKACGKKSNLVLHFLGRLFLSIFEGDEVQWGTRVPNDARDPSSSSVQQVMKQVMMIWYSKRHIVVGLGILCIGCLGWQWLRWLEWFMFAIQRLGAPAASAERDWNVGEKQKCCRDGWEGWW